MDLSPKDLRKVLVFQDATDDDPDQIFYHGITRSIRSYGMKQNDRVNTMETPMAVNTGLAFVLELAMLAAFGYWGFQGDKSIWMKWVLGIGTPLAVAILWELILAPRAVRRLNITARSILSLALFCLAAAALYQSGQPALAITFAVIAIINRVLLFLWKQW